nr:hypothetical protein [Nocardioides ungokensis]
MAMARPPATALPAMIDGTTRSGSAAANGMAPSVMNDAPRAQAALPLSRSGRLKQARADGRREREAERRDHAGDHDGGHHLQLRRVGGRGGRREPGGREGVGDLVERTTHVEGLIRPRITPSRIDRLELLLML